MRRILLPVVLLALLVPAGSAMAAKRPTIRADKSSFGRVIWDGKGRALYLFTADKHGKSSCYGNCAKAWPPYYAHGRLRAGKGTKQSLLGVTRRKGGARQVTYRGHPLYYYVGDPVGEIRCQNVFEFGGTWLIVKPNGRPLK